MQRTTRIVLMRYLWSVVVGIAVLELLIFWRGYPLRLALLAGLATAALVYYVFVAVANVRRS